jgi:hypothetical protein
MPDVDALRRTARHVLELVRDTFEGVRRTHEHLFALTPEELDSDRRGTLRVISSLAEGADQWVVEEALELHYQLQCPLPFWKEQYVKDFSDPGRFERLLSRATAVYELDGKRGEDGEAARAYEAAGRLVLDQSDLLIAVWDGNKEYGVGGTGQMVREALQRGLPTVWINWAGPREGQLHNWRLLQTPSDLDEGAALTELVTGLLLPPASEGSSRTDVSELVTELLLPPACEGSPGTHVSADLREVYFCEPAPKARRIFAGVWPLFRRCLSRKVDFHKKDISRDSAKAWRFKANGELLEHHLAEPLAKWIDESFGDHYDWANQLAEYYANLYRSAFVVSFLVAALAVLFALFAIGLHYGYTGSNSLRISWTWSFTILELFAIGGILSLTWFGRRRRWHERWIDYRTLAERLRLARFLVLFGGGGQQSSVPGHLATYGNPAGTWMQWHYRAVERAAGLPAPRSDEAARPTVRVDGTYLTACREVLLEALIEDQKRYHSVNETELSRLDAFLKRAGSGCFGLTALACLVQVASLGVESLRTNPPRWIPTWLDLAKVHIWEPLILTNAGLPAFGAAAAAIHNQGEFQRVARRSRAMFENLSRLGESLANIPTRPYELSSVRLRESAVQIARLMVNEQLDWRIVFQDRPPVLPA